VTAGTVRLTVPAGFGMAERVRIDSANCAAESPPIRTRINTMIRITPRMPDGAGPQEAL